MTETDITNAILNGFGKFWWVFILIFILMMLQLVMVFLNAKAKKKRREIARRQKKDDITEAVRKAIQEERSEYKS